jgi:hypothetical protein
VVFPTFCSNLFSFPPAPSLFLIHLTAVMVWLLQRLSASRQAAALQRNNPSPLRGLPDLLFKPLLLAEGFDRIDKPGQRGFGWSGELPEIHQIS